jgi:phage repressor protein C with HTH and peptisase S24 domain
MTSTALVYQEHAVNLFPEMGNLFLDFQHDRQKIYYTKDGMSIKTRLIEFIDFMAINPKTFEVTAGLGNGFVNNAGDSVRRVSLEKISKAYPQLNTAWLLTGEGNMLKPTSNNPVTNESFKSNTIIIGEMPGPGEETELTPLGNNKYGLTVPLIPHKAYAGYIDNFGDPEFIESLDKHTVSVVGFFRGRYFAFVVEGDSMENYSSEELAKKSIPNGTIVTAREIPRPNWRNKLHMHRFQNYVIITHDGIITKQIIEHNTVEGYIICHSLNPKYSDIKIMLDDCVQILNVVRRDIPE